MQKITSLLASTIMTVIISAPAWSDDGYLVIDTLLEPHSKREPKWISLKRCNTRTCVPYGGHYTFVEAGEVIAEIPPGKYIVAQIGFQNNKFGRGVVVTGTELLAFEVLEAHITVFGLIYLTESSRHRNEYQIEIYQPEILLQWACDENSELFDIAPVHMVTGPLTFETVRIRCEGRSGPPD
ncbi:hypothetical protein [Microbulbifer yueqingensis]|uniref:Uncharacterized protein n=1 Tax=Microbulbifer yueqingensis TaxID=658219 RepID=A0A1G8UQ02_9GAMM|nr:hypothetical protein [Microbulbifer yueqingensis]SDJ55881.1 hypothetical protein SAMN05216212_0224 [Microbulbifer yueqingensis]